MKISYRIKGFRVRHKKSIDLAASVAGPLIMGTAHLAATVSRFSWLTFNYCLFSYVLVAVRLILTAVSERRGERRTYLAGALSLFALSIPMTVAMVKTILEKGAPVYLFFWFIYAYAAFGTVKLVLAIRERYRAHRSGGALREVTSQISLVAAFYTLQMMEFALIATFDTDVSYSMLLMQYFTHGAIVLFTGCVIVRLMVKWAKGGKKRQARKKTAN